MYPLKIGVPSVKTKWENDDGLGNWWRGQAALLRIVETLWGGIRL